MVSEKQIEGSSATDGGRERKTTVQSAVVLTMLPHLLFALSFVIFDLAFDRRLVVNGTVTVFVLAMSAALLQAWRRRWPLWSGSWAGYWFLMPFMLATRFVPQIESVLLALPLLIVLIALHRPLFALLALMPPLLFFSRAWTFELVIGGDWVWLGVWLLLALASAAIVWRATVRAGVLILVSFHLLTGAAFAISRNVLPYRFPEMVSRQRLTIQAFVNDFAPLTLALMALTLALALLSPLWQMRRWDKRNARGLHGLLLLGMALTFGGVLTLRSLPAAVVVTVALAALVIGLLLSLGSAAALTRATGMGGQSQRRLLLVPFLAAFAPLVVLPQATPVAPNGAYAASTQLQILLGYAGTLLWVLGALWVLTADERPGHGAARSRTRQPRAALLCVFIVLGMLLSTTGCQGAMAEVDAEPLPTTFSAPQVEINDGGLRVTSEDAEWDGFGEVLEIRGDLALLGATDWNHYGDGYAYLYHRSGDSWQLEAQLAASDRGPGAPAHPGSMGGQRFGSSVSLGDGILAVGAPGTDARAGAAVYVFEHDGQTWAETAKLRPESESDEPPAADAAWLTGDRMPRRTFGALVSLHGDTLAVGGDAATRSVVIFERSGAGWRQQATIGIPGMPDHDLYMVSMDFYGGTLALSAFYVPAQAPLSEESLNVMNMLLTGKPVVYLFERDGPRWRETLRFAPQDNASQGNGSQETLLFLREVNIGASVALEGDGTQATRLAVGLPGFPDLSAIEDLREAPMLVGAEPGDEPIPGFPPSPREVGSVTLFERNGDVWQQDAILIPETEDGPPGPGAAFVGNPAQIFDPANLATMVWPGHLYSEAPQISFFGATVDLDGERLAVTSGYANATHVFEHTQGKWQYLALVKPPQDELWEDYAQVARLNGNTLLLGTPGEFGNSARFFDLPAESVR